MTRHHARRTHVAQITVVALVLSFLSAMAAPAAADPTWCIKKDGEYIACVTP